MNDKKKENGLRIVNRFWFFEVIEWAVRMLSDHVINDRRPFYQKFSTVQQLSI